MNELDSYIRTLERKLFMLSGSVRSDIVKEVRGHLEDSARSYGGKRRGMRKAIAEFGPPEEIAREYRGIYEPGLQVYVAISAVAATIALRSHPFLGASSSVLFALLALFLVFASMAFGKRLGLTAAVVAVATRLIQTGYILQAYPDYLEYSATGMALFVVASLLLIPIGYFPGTLRERFIRDDMF